MSEGIETGRGRRGAYVHHDAVNGELRGRKGARLAALTSGGAIPETGDYRVVAEPDDTFIGTVNEDWAVESMAGDIFLLGTHSWQIRRVEAGVVRVRDAGTAPPTVPFWMGEAPARTAELSDGGVRAAPSRRRAPRRRHDPDGARRWLEEHAGISAEAATMIVDYLAVGRAVLGVMPTQHHLVLERFFDETGGMQLVVHSPYGGRINRALGLALRKKFCRTFNFELQAAATDDAIVLSLGPHHSFPLDEVPRYLNSRTIDDTLRHAILDSPMFLARWRWNLNRSLMVLRFRNGRRNPPPIQRMESDDLMAAVFPQAAACQENVTGPIEIPDHVLVRQTIADTLHEALDVDGVRACSSAWSRARSPCTAATPPSRRCSRTRSSPRGRTRSSTTRSSRTGAPTRSRCGAGSRSTSPRSAPSTPRPSIRCTSEITPEPATADDLHDLLSSMVLARAVDDWQAPFDDSWWREAAHDDRSIWRVELWCTTERAADAERAGAGDEAAIAQVLRGHLEVVGITTAEELAARTTLPDDAGVGRPGAPRARRLRPARPLHRPFLKDAASSRSGRAANGWRRLLAHALVLATQPSPGRRAGDRARLHAVPPALAARRAGHPARRARPGSSR